MRFGTIALAALAAMSAAGPVPVAGQEQGDDGTESTVRPVKEEDVDTIIVRAGRRSRGMAAFESGDYATAEIEFGLNARCALRRERNRLAGIDQIQQGQIGQEAGLAPSAGQANPQGPGSSAPPPASAGAQNFQAPAQAFATGSDDDLDCGERGFQIYMKGLSQLQLGKVEEAEDSFRQAGNLNKNLYDAQYRLGLIALLNGDEKEARWRLNAIKRILKRCRKCQVREEIIVRRDHLEAALRGEAEMSRE